VGTHVSWGASCPAFKTWTMIGSWPVSHRLPDALRDEVCSARISMRGARSHHRRIYFFHGGSCGITLVKLTASQPPFCFSMT